MDFAYPHINVIAILAAAAAQFVLGFVWYSGMTPIGKRWMSEMGLSDMQPNANASMAIFPIGSIMAAWAVAMVVGWSGADGPLHGVYAGWVVAMAVAAQALAGGVASGKSSIVLTVINVGYVVVGYAIMGAIVAALSA